MSREARLKTVGGEDILYAMTKLGFENYSEALQVYLARYRKSLVDGGDNQTSNTAGSSGPAPAALNART
jgi:pre-mRNA-splicing factor ATP-dependent RNA helicase DHX38/PRP16